jgi:CheY-like chemotaxis protein
MLASMRERSRVLLVEADAEERATFGAWLEAGGFEVLECPGPSEPDYTCVGSRGGPCALTGEADVIVLDMSLRSEGVMMGTASEELLGRYLVAGHRVVALGSHPGAEIRGQLARIRRHPGRHDLLAAVAALADD